MGSGSKPPSTLSPASPGRPLVSELRSDWVIFILCLWGTRARAPVVGPQPHPYPLPPGPRGRTAQLDHMRYFYRPQQPEIFGGYFLLAA
jgi:hypothetical protein